MGDEVSKTRLEELYYQYGKVMFYTALDILNDYHEAQDVVQMAFIKIFPHLEKIIEIKCNKTKAFVVIVVRNTAINIYNKRKKDNILPYDRLDDLVETMKDNPEQYILKLDQGKEMAKSLAELKPEYADILTLRYTYEYEEHEIGQLIGITEGAVRVKLSRARKSLRRILGGKEYGK